MKKLVAILVSVGMLFTTCAFADNIIIPNSAFNQSENSLARWFMWLPMDTTNHKTYHDLLKENFESTFQELITAFELNGIEGEKAEKIRRAYGLEGYHTKIFYLDEIQQTFNAAYGTNINMASLDGYETIIVRDGYFITILYPHGTDARPVPIEGKNMEDNTQYWTWQYQDEWNTSDYIYTIITTKNVCGYNIRCIEYIGYSGLSSSQTDWETGKYNEYMTIGDIIYYYGLYYHEDGSIDSRYTIRTYNKRTREDKPLTYQGYSLNRIGNKLWFLTGTSTGSWDRNLWCCDLDGKNPKFITNGFDWNVAFDIEIENPFVVFNNRMYIGHNTDMEHFEVISCDLEGNDIRTETPSVYSTRWDCKLYEHYAVINDTIYPYQYSSEKVIVKLNDDEISFDQPPLIYNDRTLVPMRAIFEAMGCEVVWNDGVINVYKDDENIMTLWVNTREMWLPSGSVTLDVAPMVINDRTLVPVRAITESMGAKVEWDGDLKIVYISYSETT